MTGRLLTFNIFEIPWLLPGCAGLVLLTGLIAGSYPAFFLAALQPARILKDRFKKGASGSRLRRILVVTQFTISITLIIGTGLIKNQLDFMKNKNPGFNKEHVIILPMSDDSVREIFLTLKNEFKTHPGIISVAASSSFPGNPLDSNDKIPEGYTAAQRQLMDEINVDADFIATMGMEIIAGRNFSEDFESDRTQSVKINETAVQQYSWENPLGKIIRTPDPADPNAWVPKTVICVIKDVHFAPLSQVIQPLFMGNDPDYPFNFFRFISIRIRPDNINETLKFIKKKWNEFVPHVQYSASFLDLTFNRQFSNIERSRSIFSYFTLLAIFIACLGLFGMAAFTSEQRTKEIGIRKILGSSSTGIILLLSKELIVLIILGNIIAWPLTYVMLTRWIQNFPYHVNISFFTFIASGIMVLLIGLATISFQAFKAALAHPVISLKNE